MANIRYLTAGDVIATTGLSIPHYIVTEADGRRTDRERLPKDVLASEHARRTDTAHVQHEFEEDEDGRIIAALTIVIPQGVEA